MIENIGVSYLKKKNKSNDYEAAIRIGKNMINLQYPDPIMIVSLSGTPNPKVKTMITPVNICICVNPPRGPLRLGGDVS